jgi:hypothetical protein
MMINNTNFVIRSDMMCFAMEDRNMTVGGRI